MHTDENRGHNIMILFEKFKWLLECQISGIDTVLAKDWVKQLQTYINSFDDLLDPKKEKSK
jgi:hypothetical protein